MLRVLASGSGTCAVADLRANLANMLGFGAHKNAVGDFKRRRSMAWTTPVLVEICIGLEINGYLPAEI